MSVDDRTVNKMARYIFSRTELLDQATTLGKALEEKDHADRQRKAAADHWKSKISDLDSTINECARKIRDKYEMRETPCKVVADYEARMMRFYSVDDMSLVEERPLTAIEMQRQLDFEADEKQKADEAAEDETESGEPGDDDDPDAGNEIPDGTETECEHVDVVENICQKCGAWLTESGSWETSE